jgi:hypothetical protein
VVLTKDHPSEYLKVATKRGGLGACYLGGMLFSGGSRSSCTKDRGCVGRIGRLQDDVEADKELKRDCG